MSTMRASVMPDFERRPTLADIPAPEAGPGEVLVRVHAASVNGVDHLPRAVQARTAAVGFFGSGKVRL
jgi:NADPH:quinone reductase-like Zn-dependent oxidoreductase